MAEIDKTEWVAVEVKQVGTMVYSEESEEDLVVLSDISNPRNVILIWIGDFEARAIGFAWMGEKLLRPLTHDLLFDVIRTVGAEIKAVFITELRGNTYYAKILLEKDDRPIEIDSRPSDAIALALRAKAPIYAAKDLMGEFKELQDIVGTGIEEDELKKQIRETILKTVAQPALIELIIELIARRLRVEPESSEPERKIERLKNLMRNAVSREDYETAAHLRNKINALRQQEGDQ